MELLKSKKAIIFLLIVFIAIVFRFWKLTEYPVSLSIDEVGMGYNAYSILKTGKDEWGEVFPLAFKSIGDYKLPVNIYLMIPSIAIFGLNEFAVRFPVALFSVLCVVAFMFFLRELNFSWLATLFTGFWLAIVPWNVHFSRSSYETSLALSLLILALLVFLIGIRKKNYWLFGISIILFGISMWTYNAERFLAPFIVIFLILSFSKTVFGFLKEKKAVVLFGTILLLLVLPFLILSFNSDAIVSRPLSTSIFREPSLSRILHNGNYANIQEFIFDNDIYLIFRHWFGKYSNYFDLSFWFWRGMNFTAPGLPNLGLFYVVDLPIILIGMFLLFFSKNIFLRNLGIFWFLIGIIPASFTMNEQQSLRALIWLPFFGLAFASGIEWLNTNMKKWKIVFVSIYFILLSFNVLYAVNIYTNHFPRIASEYWQYGFEESARFACENREKYDRIIMSEVFGSLGPFNTGTPYAYVLFYCKYDPESFRRNNRNIDGIYFSRINWKHDWKVKNMLLIASPWDLKENQIPQDKIIKRTYFLNGKLAFLFVETREGDGH